MDIDFELTNYAETYETDDIICPQSTFKKNLGLKIKFNQVSNIKNIVLRT